MAHDGPLAAGTRHRSPTRTSVPARVDRPGAGVPGRRTVTITGRGAERRSVPSRHGRDQRRPYVPRHERDGFRPDRAAGIAVALALLLILVAAASAHAAVLNAHTSRVSAAAVHAVESAQFHRLR
jgi:Flp pilus assembly protein TadB